MGLKSGTKKTQQEYASSKSSYSPDKLLLDNVDDVLVDALRFLLQDGIHEVRPVEATQEPLALRHLERPIAYNLNSSIYYLFLNNPTSCLVTISFETVCSNLIIDDSLEYLGNNT